MPFPNEHSARLLDPKTPHVRVRRTKGSGKGTVQGVKIPSSIGVIWYIVKSGGAEVPRAQALRFPISSWTESEAKVWLSKNEIKFKSFEKAGPVKGDEVEVDKDDSLETVEMNWGVRDTIDEMIKAGNVDRDTTWAFTDQDRNALLGDNGDEWQNYGSVHLGEDLTFERDDIKRYLYPVIKDGIVFRDALIKAKKATKAKDQWMFYAIDRLLGDIDTPMSQDQAPAQSVSQSRQDLIFLPDDDDDMNEKFERTAEGFLKGRAIVTNVGVFPYLRPDGTVVWELRPPEEVFHPDSVQSLSMSPLTNGHPAEPVTSENAKDLSVGFIGDKILTDAYHLSAPIQITDAEAVDEVEKNGKRALSAGYSVDIEEASGVWMGVPYDSIQRNVRYNHVAIVDRGRAGDDAVMKLDAAERAKLLDTSRMTVDAMCIDVNKYRKNESKQEVDDMSEILKTTKIDGVDYKAEAKVIETLNQTQTKLDEATEAKKKADEAASKVEAERDSLKEKLDKAEKDIKDLNEAQPGKIDEAVKARINLHETAKKAGVEIKEDMSEKDVMKAVVLKVQPNSEAKLDEKKDDESYLKARFDAAVEDLEGQTQADEENRTDASDAGAGEAGAGEPNAEKSRKDMIDKQKDAWKRKKE